MARSRCFSYFCASETIVFDIGICVRCTWICWNGTAFSAHHALSVIGSGCLSEEFASVVSMVVQHRVLGPYLRNFLLHKAIPLKVKVVSVSLVWITLSYCAVFLVEYLMFRLLFVLLAAGITIHILSYRTLR